MTLWTLLSQDPVDAWAVFAAAYEQIPTGHQDPSCGGHMARGRASRCRERVLQETQCLPGLVLPGSGGGRAAGAGESAGEKASCSIEHAHRDRPGHGGWQLADRTKVAVFQLIDDHSRPALASLVAGGETSAAAITVVALAIERHGVPQKFLSENGAALNPTRRGRTGALAEFLKAKGVQPITGKPTTQGKNERFIRSLLQHRT